MTTYSWNEPRPGLDSNGKPKTVIVKHVVDKEGILSMMRQTASLLGVKINNEDEYIESFCATYWAKEEKE